MSIQDPMGRGCVSYNMPSAGLLVPGIDLPSPTYKHCQKKRCGQDV